MSDSLTAELLPIQLAFLDELASKPEEVTQILKDCRISGQRLAGWLADPAFRGAYFVRCAHYEEMQFPAFIAAVRRKATGLDKDASKYAKIYMDFIAARTESLLAAHYNAETPPNALEEPKENGLPEQPREEESIVDLLGGSQAATG